MTRGLLLFLLLAGCASTVEIPKEVRVPVPVPCIAPQDKPQRPPLASEADLLLLDTYRRTWALWGDRAAREAYQVKLEAVVEGCSLIPAQPTR